MVGVAIVIRVVISDRGCHGDKYEQQKDGLVMSSTRMHAERGAPKIGTSAFRMGI